MNFDPYKTLGVPRDADEAEIRAAGKLAAKKHHPDAGGDMNSFAASRRALAILLDAGKRSRFDSTGTVEERQIDVNAGALELIHGELAKLTDNYLKSGFNVTSDPRRCDLPALLRQSLITMLETLKANQRSGQQHALFLFDLAKRFKKRKGKGANLIGRGIEFQARAVDAKVADLAPIIAAHEIAIKLLDDYDFDRDQSVTWTVMTATNATTNW